MPNKVLVVFNSSEHRYPGRNTQYYISAIRSILEQEFEGLHLTYSGFCPADSTINALVVEFGDSISYYLTSQCPLPVNITFNRAIQKTFQAKGEFESIIYIDSGCNLIGQPNVIAEMYKMFEMGQFGMVAVNTNEDNGESFWGLNYSGRRVILPVGKTANLHCQLFDTEIYRQFGNRIMPDIFASYCSESVFGTLCYSINKHFLMLGDIVIQHKHSMDFGSSSLEEERKQLLAKEGRSWSHLFTNKRTIDDIINNPEMRACGAFYEECQGVVRPNMDCYNDGLCKDPERLKRFVADNFFLTKDEFDYESIRETFIT